MHWMENIRDWCISRQLWWGHRIPVWYCANCGAEFVIASNDADRNAAQVRSERARAGPGRARHVVLVGALAALDARLAGGDRRPAVLLPDVGHADGLRHHLLLGRADDHDGPLQHGEVPFRRRLPARPHPRPAGPQDDEEPGQRRRPARASRTSTAPTRCASRSPPAAAPGTTSGCSTRSSKAGATSRTRSGTQRASSSRASARRQVRLPEDARTVAKRSDWPLEDRWIVSRVLATAQEVNRAARGVPDQRSRTAAV